MTHRALAWWESLPLYVSNDLERKYGYFGHDIGLTEDEIIGMWKDEGSPEEITNLKEAAIEHAKHGGPFSTRGQNYAYSFEEGAEWQKQRSFLMMRWANLNNYTLCSEGWIQDTDSEPISDEELYNRWLNH